MPDRGGPPVHGDARRRKATLAHRDQRPAWHLPERRADPDRVSPPGPGPSLGGMSRELQLGERWLRYQRYADRGATFAHSG